ncbi:MAG: DMT family transporter, partial [Chloroflexota bacterium]
MKLPTHFLGHLAAFFTISVWGLTFISTKVLMNDYSPVEIMFFRLALALAVLLIASPPRPGRLDRQALRDEAAMAAAGLCGVTLFFLAQNSALAYTLTANVSVLMSMSPLFTALASRALFNERLKANFFLGFAAAMAGMILVAFNGSFLLKLSPLGDLLSMLAALSWAAYSLLIKRFGGRQGGVLCMTRKVFFYGLLFLLPALPWLG